MRSRIKCRQGNPSHRETHRANAGPRARGIGFQVPALAIPALALVIASPFLHAAETDAAASDVDPVTAAFSEHDPQSTRRLDHGLWSDFLSKTVVYTGHSTGRRARGQKRTWVGSKMRFGNTLPSRYENNRVVLSGFGDEHFELIEAYREGLESVPDKVPLSSLNRDEQLAFWLNLYNAHALEHVASHYPGTTARVLRSAPGEPAEGVWHEPTLNVAGIPLSLADIERRILFPIWNDPLVLYGLWQGAIGGPRLPLHAYGGATVWRTLRENASEFVNSNRGMEPKGDVLEVSMLYGWGMPLFQNDGALLRHVAALAEPPFSDGLDAVSRVRIDLYDWHLADLSGGTHHEGQWNNMAAFVAGLENTPNNQLFASNMMRTDTTRETMPAQTIELLRNMQQFNDRSRRTRVSLRECPKGGDCPLSIDQTENDAKDQ